MGSRGSVIPFFLSKAKSGTIPITHERMTRFNITLKAGVEMVLWALHSSYGSELFVPKIPSYRIMDLVEAIGPNCKKEFVGIRPGEKIYEEMITASDSYSTVDLGSYYAILPSGNFITSSGTKSIDSYIELTGSKLVKNNFSSSNRRFKEVKSFIKTCLALLPSKGPTTPAASI